MATKYINDYKQAVDCTVKIKTDSYERILSKINELTDLTKEHAKKTNLSQEEINKENILKASLMPSLVLEGSFQNTKIFTECGHFIPKNAKEAKDYNDMVNFDEYGMRVKESLDNLIDHLKARSDIHTDNLFNQIFELFSTFNAQEFGLEVKYIGETNNLHSCST
jgi:predicted HAD superfamily phosphohydrolase